MKPSASITICGKKYPLYELTVKRNLFSSKLQEITVMVSNTELHDFIEKTIDNPEIDEPYCGDVDEFLPQEILDMPEEEVVKYFEEHYYY